MVGVDAYSIKHNTSNRIVSNCPLKDGDLGPGHISIAHLTALGRGCESCNCRQRPSLHLGFSCVEEKKRKGRKVSESEGKQVRVPGGRIWHSGSAGEFFRGIFRGIQSGVECLRPQGRQPVDRYLVLSADNRMICQRC